MKKTKRHLKINKKNKIVKKHIKEEVYKLAGIKKMGYSVFITKIKNNCGCLEICGVDFTMGNAP